MPRPYDEWQCSKQGLVCICVMPSHSIWDIQSDLEPALLSLCGAQGQRHYCHTAQL